MPSMWQDVAAREIAVLDSKPRWAQIGLGFGALFSAAGAGLFGSLQLVGGFHRAGGWRASLALSLGGGLLLVAAFMTLIWLRMWFGRRPWLDHLLQQLFWRSYLWLLVAVLLLLAVADRIMVNR